MSPFLPHRFSHHEIEIPHSMANQRVRILAVVSLSLFVSLQLYFIATHGDSFEKIISQEPKIPIVESQSRKEKSDDNHATLIPFGTKEEKAKLSQTPNTVNKNTESAKVPPHQSKEKATQTTQQAQKPSETQKVIQTNDCEKEEDITARLTCLNNKELIRNSEKFKSLPRDGVIISMLAYGRPKILRLVMEGLKQVF